MTNDDPMYLRHLEKALEAAELEIKGMLEGTLRQAKKDGDEWPEKFQYTIIEVEPNVEVRRGPTTEGEAK